MDNGRLILASLFRTLDIEKQVNCPMLAAGGARFCTKLITMHVLGGRQRVAAAERPTGLRDKLADKGLLCACSWPVISVENCGLPTGQLSGKSRLFHIEPSMR